VRKLCPACKRPDRSLSGGTAFDAKGCAACTQTGYAGRTGIYELFTVDDEAKRLIHAGESEHALRAHGTAQGMRVLREDGMRWVTSGVTSLAEVVRVTRES